MAAPLVAQWAGAGSADAAGQPGEQTLTALDGLAELRLTDLALKRLAARGIGVQAVDPATPILATDGTTVAGVKLTPEYAGGTILATGQPGKGSGRAHGGVVLANSVARMEITGIRGSVPDGVVVAFLKVNDEWLGELPLFASDPGAVRLSLQPGTPGQPILVSGNGIPVTPTQEGVNEFASAFGTTLFTTTDTVFTASGHGSAWPVPSFPA